MDPNEEIRASLSDAEREAYDVSLLGPVIEVIEEGESGNEGGEEIVNEGDGALVVRDEREGCRHQAEAQISGSDLSVLDEETQAAVHQVFERLFADRRVIAADEEWHRCIGEAGYPVEPSSDPGYRPTGQDLVLRMMDELLGTAVWTTETLVADDGTSAEIEVPDLDEEALADLREAELAIALADLDCDEQVGRTTTFQAVRAEIELEVVQEHFTELSEAIVDTGD